MTTPKPGQTPAAANEREDLDAEGFGYWPEAAQAAILRRDAEIARLRAKIGADQGSCSEGFGAASVAPAPANAAYDSLFRDFIRWLLDRDPEYARKLVGRRVA